MSSHLDDTGQPCSRHGAMSEARLYELAVIGSRVPGFHHDAASKLQSLMMALDEISEFAERGDPEMRIATDTAHAAVRELHALFTMSRAFVRPPSRTRSALAELVAAGCARAAVKLTGDALAEHIQVSIPSATYALTMLLDLVAGPPPLGRTIQATVQASDHEVSVTFTGPPDGATVAPATANEVIALATFLIERDGGQLRCSSGRNQIVVRFVRG